MRRAGFAMIAGLLCLAATAHAQSMGRIVGTVTAADGSGPVVGARVLVSGTRFGAVTRDDGRYSIELQPGTYRVTALRIGFAPDSVRGVTVTSGGSATVNFSLRPTGAVLSGIVVVGYGNQEERNRTSAVEQVSEKEFQTGRIVSPEQLIQAKVAGVQVVPNNEPGGGIATIRCTWWTVCRCRWAAGSRRRRRRRRPAEIR